MWAKKKSFWLLLLVFSLLVFSGLAINAGNTNGEMAMMGFSMGGMMKIHHASNLKPADLLRPLEADHGQMETSGHHILAPLLESLALFTTITVFLFIPLLLGGTMLLIVLWA